MSKGKGIGKEEMGRKVDKAAGAALLVLCALYCGVAHTSAFKMPRGGPLMSPGPLNVNVHGGALLLAMPGGGPTGIAGVDAPLNALYIKYPQTSNPNFHHASEAFIAARMLPVSVSTNVVFPVFDARTDVPVASFSAGSRGRGVAAPIGWPEGFQWGGTGYVPAPHHTLGILDCGRLVFGFMEKAAHDGSAGLPFASSAEVRTLAPMWGDFHVRPALGSRVWRRETADEFLVVWENMFLEGEGAPTNGVSFACALGRSGPGEPGNARFMYGPGVDVEVLARTASGAQWLNAGYSLHTPEWNELGLADGVEVRMLGLGNDLWLRADPSGSGLNRLGKLLYGLDPAKWSTHGAGVPDGWLVQHWGWFLGAGLDPRDPGLGAAPVADGSITAAQAWGHYIDPGDTPPPGGMSFGGRVGAGLDPHGGPTPGTALYGVRAVSRCDEDYGVTFHFQAEDAAKDARRQRWHCKPGEAPVVMLPVYWGVVYRVGTYGEGTVELDDTPMGFEVLGNLDAAASAPTCALPPDYPRKGKAIAFSPCYQPTEWDYYCGSWNDWGVQFWHSPGVVFDDGTQQPWIIADSDWFWQDGDGHWHAACGCRLVAVAARHSFGNNSGYTETYVRTEHCECVRTQPIVHYWFVPEPEVTHFTPVLCAQVRRPDESYDTAALDFDIAGYDPAYSNLFANIFDVEVEGWREGFTRAGANPPYTITRHTQDNIARFRRDGQDRWPLDAGTYSLEWDGRAEKNCAALEDEPPPPHGLGDPNLEVEPMRRFLYELKNGEPVLGHSMNFTVRIRWKAPYGQPGPVYSETTFKMHFKQVVKQATHESAITELTRLETGRPNMLAIGLTNLTAVAATNVMEAAKAHTRERIWAAVPEGSNNLLEFVGDDAVVLGSYKTIHYSGDAGLKDLPNYDSRGLGFTFSRPTTYYPDGDCYVNVTVILNNINRNVPRFGGIGLPALTNLDDLAKFIGSVGTHEFGHNSGLIHRRYFKIDADNPIPPGQESANHYNYSQRPSPTVPVTESMMVMMADRAYTDIQLGKHGPRLWKEYDLVHLSHQYTKP
jgi:hypothetical protein